MKSRGNRCGHDPRQIRRRLVRGGGSRRQPAVLVEGARAFARAIVERPLDFPELAATRETDRARRSERLEAIGLVVQALVVRCDLLTLVVKWRGAGLEERTIGRWTGMTVRRVRRALFDLRWAHFARGPGRFGPGRIPQPVEEYAPGKYRGKAAIRQLTPELFASVGMLGWLKDCQAARYKAQQPQRSTSTPAHLTRALVQRRAVTDAISSILAGRAPPE
jgi:hypothetical protein